ncbi:MAG: hypothetical protein HYU35_02630, partial [Parcubacteria group bacterium]|nr:hypothetical protein [Parcubacteria group bacterium]
MQTNIRIFCIVAMVCFAASSVAVRGEVEKEKDYVSMYGLDRFRNAIVPIICEEPKKEYVFFGNGVVVSKNLLLSVKHLISTGCKPYAYINEERVDLEIKKNAENGMDLVLFSLPGRFSGTINPVVLEDTSHRYGSVFLLGFLSYLERERVVAKLIVRKGRLR